MTIPKGALKKACLLIIFAIVIWTALGNQYTVQAAEELTIITTAEELADISENLNGNYQLANDIDLTSYLSDKANGWRCIANFTGTLDGKGHKITGLWNNSAGAYKGLFASAENATIQNLSVELDAKGLSGGYEIGGIIGVAHKATVIENCSVSGGSIKVTGGGYAGGIVGRTIGSTEARGTVSNCNVLNMDISTSGNYSGGVIGVAYKTDISRCKVSGVHAEGTSYVGGLAGAIHGQSVITDSSAQGSSIDAKTSYAGGFIGAMYEQSQISKSYAVFHTVQSKLSYAGGFIGTAYEEANISYCYATADVSSVSGEYVGGFAGEINATTVVNACATGKVEAREGQIAGGFAGIAYNKSSLTRCQALGDVSSDGNYAGGLVGKLHAKSIQSASTVEQCSAYGDVTANGYVVGGLIGECVYSKVSNSYARGDVSGTTGVGGLVGYFSGTASSGQTVYNSYSAGKVTGNSGSKEVGAFTGFSGVTFTGTNYYDSNNASISASNGSQGFPEGSSPQGMDTEMMMKQSTFDGWNFNGIWNIVEGETYPYFDFCGFTPEVQQNSKPPVINTIYITDKRISGTGISGSEILVKFPSGKTVVIKVNSEGKWFVTVPKNEALAVGDLLEAAQKEPGKLVSKPSSIVVRTRELVPEIEKTWENKAGGSEVKPGDTLLFTITVENKGNSLLSWNNVVTVDALHPYLSFDDETFRINGEAPIKGHEEGQYLYDSDDHTVTVYLGTLTPGDSKIITFEVEINASVPKPSEISSGLRVTGSY